MNDSMKGTLAFVYMFIGAVYTLVDIIQSYGDDGLIFWLFIRPFISLLKGVVWPIALMW
jgi:hypothetical protein